MNATSALRSALRRALIVLASPCMDSCKGRTNRYSLLDGERSLTPDTSDRSSVSDQIAHRCATKKKKEEDEEKSSDGAPRAAEISTTTFESPTAPSGPEEIRGGDHVGGIEEEAERVEYMVDAYQVATGVRQGSLPRDAATMAAALELARRGVESETFLQVVRYGLRCSDEYTRQRMSSGLRAAAKCFGAVSAQWASAPRVKCSAWPQSEFCEFEFVPDLLQRRAIRQAGGADGLYLTCPACASHCHTS